MRVAVLIPCYNEALTIAEVVRSFHKELPTARIYVFDNNSTDATPTVALEAGATVMSERRQGKGYVVQTMFRRVDAEIYVMVDGDGTYPASSVHRLLEPIVNGEADMVVGSRLHRESRSNFKAANLYGNKLIRWLLRLIFRVKLTDILSGYRAFNRSFVKGLPLFGGGFEVETELTIKALQRGYRIEEVPVNLEVRPKGSYSKIHFIRDGFLILNTMLSLFRDTKPLTFFGGLGLMFVSIGIAVLFSAAKILGITLALIGVLFVLSGLHLHTIVRRFQEFDHQLRILESEFEADRRVGKADREL
jgi:glycosyltransferase involved in cell wall biosynthesis